MNHRMIFNILGKILVLEAALLLFPLGVSLIYQEQSWYAWVITIASLLVCGLLLVFLIKPKHNDFYAKDGFVVVGLSWVVMSLFGCLPFVISRQIPSFVDAFFETISGFTTTGGSILSNVEVLSHSMLFWRSFTHWLGGMGVLVFILAILPNSNGQNIFILKAESTGPQVGKLVSKLKFTARILYLMYGALTIIEMIFLLCGGMPIFDSIVNSLATAGTGGFAINNAGIGGYTIYSQVVIGVFMLLFGINFSIYYLLMVGKIKQVLHSEELRWYLGIIFVAVAFITCDIMVNLPSLYQNNFGGALKDSFFQVSSIITTTGFATTNFNLWPTFSKIILFCLMFVGGCAGSTGGGMKVSRIIIMIKSCIWDMKKMIHPNAVQDIKYEGGKLDKEVVEGVKGYTVVYALIIFVASLIIAIDGLDFETTISSVVACINNIGPGFGLVGPIGNFGDFSIPSKLVFIILMLIGRLEVYPIILMLNPLTYSNKR
ncbi:MAG: TrkH family potassium uptake protein [Bacilli bacterium]|mgnify:CR=1 FL=1|nr:TrkH family potassium uptake protein [Bacilli bacterium]